MYKKVSADMNFEEREQEVRAFWNQHHIFEKSIEKRQGQPLYMFYDGPPTANGKPHIGHVLTRAIKDIIPRYRTMKGYQVPRKAGWDTHGLPVELEVEKALGLEGKEHIERYGLESFIEKCKESVWRYKGMWEGFSDTVGFWADMENPYITYQNDFIESEWWALKQIWEKGLLYKGFKIVPYCPRCETPLSSHEVAQGYKEVKERSAFVKFTVKGEENTFFLVWTTTPWTLPSNVALCVNPKEPYVKVKYHEEFYYIAEALVEKVLEDEGEILTRFIGKDLEYKEYEPLYTFVSVQEKAHYVTCDEYVTLSDGTGIVHIAPAFGADDAKVGKNYQLPFVQLVNSKGEMEKETDWAGVFCKEADPAILKNLKERGLLFSAPVLEHSYPHCWRCDTPLLYYARNSWFIKMTEVKEDLLRNNQKIHWFPENIGKGRFADWLENVQDWAISRDRYWGTPLNIWECECGHQQAIGSRQELKEKAQNYPEDLDLHKPFVDRVLITCPKCQKQMKRVPEVIDGWFDSGAMPFAQYHYPFENQELFKQNFPANFISEAVDQTRGWFYSLLAVSTLLFNENPYRNVLVLGHVQDEQGQKMSKSKGNAVDPFEALKTYGADAIRWYFYSNSALWLPNRFSAKAVIEGQRKFMSTVWNTYSFYVLYANIDQFSSKDYTLDKSQLGVMDKWLLSKLNTLIQRVDQALEEYKIPEAARLLQSFVDDLSKWYIRRGRERFWAKGMERDKIHAYLALYETLLTLSKLSAPFTPFMAESMYQNLVREENSQAELSVHLCDYPQVKEDFIDPDLEEKMEKIMKIVSLGRAARNTAAIKNRQPLAKMWLQSDLDLTLDDLQIIRDELNVKEIEKAQDISSFIDYSFKPQLRTVGPKYGKVLKNIQEALKEIDGVEAFHTLEVKGEIHLSNILEETDIVLTKEDLLIESKQKDGLTSESDGGITVVLDTKLNKALIDEGFVREIVSKIQTMRKEAGFEVMDHIVVAYQGNEKIKEIFQQYSEDIEKEVLAVRSQEGLVKDYQKIWDINGEEVKLSVGKN
ncbi:isoleucine--tRNA ligase [Clostridia bacterium]|nr:isoleucine--tRNA ligase [Clostridia bacterium]